MESETKSPPTISVVSPVYLAEGIVAELVSRLKSSLDEMGESYEIILVEDGGADNSWDRVREIALKDPAVRGVKLSRNFGQHFAITAGIDLAAGQYVVVMDCDLQDDPADIKLLYEKVREGYDIVFGMKEKRNHAAYRNALSRMFFSVFNRLSDNQTANVSEGSFSILTRKAVDAYKQHRDAHRHYLMILRSMGFKRGHVKVSHSSRFEGKSSYSYKRLIALAWDGVASQSTKLLRFSIGIGFAYMAASVLGILYMFGQYFLMDSKPPSGWASTIVVILGSTGMILMALGVIGVYIGSIFDQVKGRPLYLIDEDTQGAEFEGK